MSKTTVTFHRRMDYKVKLKLPDDATTCSVPVATPLETPAATATPHISGSAATDTAHIPGPAAAAAATGTVHIPEEVAAAVEALRNGIPPEVPLDPVVGAAISSGHHERKVSELLTQMTQTSKAQIVAWQTITAYFSKLEKGTT